MTINSKHRTVAKAPYMLYMPFADMRNFVNMLPQDKKAGITADYDSISASVQGFRIGARIEERIPYSKIIYKDDGAPFKFTVEICFDAAGGDPDSTDFHINIDADLNYLMKIMIGSKIRDAIDKVVDSVADLAEGKMPEGIDPSMFPEGFDKTTFGR